MHTHDSGTRVTISSQCRLIWASTPAACTTEAIGKDDRGGDQALGAAGDHLGDGDQPDRAGRLHPVLDFAGEAELLGQLHGDGLDALEHDGEPDDAGHQHGGERRLGAGDAAGRADALADLGEDVEEDEAQEERLDQGADGELDLVLPEHDQVALDQRTRARSSWPRWPSGSASGRHGATTGEPKVVRQGRRTSWSPSVAQVLSGQPDEDGLERGFGHGQVGQGEARGLGGLDDPRDESVRAADLEFDAVGEADASA